MGITARIMPTEAARLAPPLAQACPASHAAFPMVVSFAFHLKTCAAAGRTYAAGAAACEGGQGCCFRNALCR